RQRGDEIAAERHCEVVVTRFGVAVEGDGDMPEAGGGLGQLRDRQERLARLQRENRLVQALVEPLIDLLRQLRRRFLDRSLKGKGKRQQDLAARSQSGGKIAVGIIAGELRERLLQPRVLRLRKAARRGSGGTAQI